MRWVILFLLLAAPLRAATPAILCEQVAMQVARETGVPADILGALTLTETGRRQNGVLRPWPWAVNAEGAGTWFDDPRQALDFAAARVAMGRPNVDIGCFQLNFRWHGAHFNSVAEMFDPLVNARYAAGFLRQLYAETGDWRKAAGAFHSRRPDHAARYLTRFDDLRAGLRRTGFEGMTGAGDSYNDFADAVAGMAGDTPLLTPEQFALLTGIDPRSLRGPRRERLMLLGAPLGSTAEGGGAGSLAVLGQARGPLLADAGRGALITMEPVGALQ